MKQYSGAHCMAANAAMFFGFLFILCGCASGGFSRADSAIIAGTPDSLLHILTVDNPQENAVLRRQSADLSLRAIRSGKYRQLAERMIRTVSDSTVDGVGIAAPQVGINKRVVAVQRFDKPGEPFEAYPNIRITGRSAETQTGPEGCLSVPGRRGQVCRAQWVVISYIDPATLRPVTDTIHGFTAVIFQHETDHLEGVIYTDKLR